MKIVADDKIPFLKGALEPVAELSYLPGGKISRNELMDADALLVRTRTRCNEALLAGTPVKFIATATIGFDHIDTSYCEKAGVFWTNAPGCNSSSVAQYITSVLLNLACRHRISLQGRTLGVVGVGNVGSKVAKVGAALGMRVLLNDPPRARAEGAGGFCDLSTILRESDFITFHVPLCTEGSDKTFHMVTKDLISKMKHGAFLINSSRGEVVESAALLSALEHKQLAGAVLDVWENEPEIDLKLLRALDIATPHIAGYSTDGKANGTAMSVRSLSKFFKLGLDQWSPSQVPLPPQTEFNITSSNSFEDTMRRATALSYDVMSDDNALRSSPSTFEKQRGDYPLRREAPAFTLKMSPAINKEVANALSALGYLVRQG